MSQHLPGITAEEIARETLQIIPLVMQVMASEMRSTGHSVVGGHVRLLGTLHITPLTLTELAELNMVTPPTMSNTISALESRGWVRRTRSQSDRRIVLIELTDEGRRVYSEIDLQTRRKIMALIEPLDDAHKQTLMEGLSLLRRSFEAGLPDRLGSRRQP